MKWNKVKKNAESSNDITKQNCEHGKGQGMCEERTKTAVPVGQSQRAE